MSLIDVAFNGGLSVFAVRTSSLRAQVNKKSR
jgi:hypothetical protein